MLRIGRLALLLFFSLLSTPLWAASYRFDPDHTFPLFEIDHLGFSTQRGWFDASHGTLEYDAVQHTGSLDVVIDAGSLDTGNPARDAVLKGPEWFDVTRYPAITFHGQRFLFEQDRPVAIEGTLTMLGVTQPQRLEIIRLECGLNLVNRRRVCGADATGILRRSHFGMRTGLPFVGDIVRLRIQAEAYLDNQAQ
jgi:polyisoprenoid-binding protein YceI